MVTDALTVLAAFGSLAYTIWIDRIVEKRKHRSLLVADAVDIRGMADIQEAEAALDCWKREVSLLSPARLNYLTDNINRFIGKAERRLGRALSPLGIELSQNERRELARRAVGSAYRVFVVDSNRNKTGFFWRWGLRQQVYAHVLKKGRLHLGIEPRTTK